MGIKSFYQNSRKDLQMHHKKLVLLLIGFAFSSLLNSATPADSREKFSIDEINVMDEGDLCPVSSNKRFNHHFVLVDATAELSPSQLKSLERLFLSESNLASMVPWDRLSIMMMRDIKPAKNIPLFSKCRPRSGDPASPYIIDHHNWLSESQSDLTVIYNDLFVSEVKKTILKLSEPRDPSLALSGDLMVGSPILSQIKEIFRLPDLNFRKDSGYESRTLTIISDLAQNTKRLPFYDQCPLNSSCPTWESFKNNKKYKLWAKRAIPDFGNNLEVRLLYLNNNFDPDLDRGVLDFWIDFFKDAGISDIDFEIESDNG